MNGQTKKKIKAACRVFWVAVKASPFNPYRNDQHFFNEMKKKWRGTPWHKRNIRDLFTHLTGMAQTKREKKKAAAAKREKA